MLTGECIFLVLWHWYWREPSFQNNEERNMASFLFSQPKGRKETKNIRNFFNIFDELAGKICLVDSDSWGMGTFVVLWLLGCGLRKKIGIFMGDCFNLYRCPVHYYSVIYCSVVRWVGILFFSEVKSILMSENYPVRKCTLTSSLEGHAVWSDMIDAVPLFVDEVHESWITTQSCRTLVHLSVNFWNYSMIGWCLGLGIFYNWIESSYYFEKLGILGQFFVYQSMM